MKTKQNYIDEAGTKYPFKVADKGQPLNKPAHTTTLAIVSEDATHIAFVNGKTYSREEIVQAVNAHEELIRVMNEAKRFLNTGRGKEFLLQAIAKAEGK